MLDKVVFYGGAFLIACVAMGVVRFLSGKTRKYFNGRKVPVSIPARQTQAVKRPVLSPQEYKLYFFSRYSEADRHRAANELASDFLEKRVSWLMMMEIMSVLFPKMSAEQCTAYIREILDANR